MPLTFTDSPLYYKDSQGNYQRILSGADMTGYRTAAAQDVIDAGKEASILGNLAMIESNPATQAHAIGDYIVYNGQLYKVTAAIAQGESLAVGTNVESTTVGDQFNIRTGTYTLDSGVALKNWGTITIRRLGKIVLVCFWGLYFTSQPNETHGINVPWSSTHTSMTTTAKDTTALCEIFSNSKKVVFTGVGALNTNIYGTLVYFTNDP